MIRQPFNVTRDKAVIEARLRAYMNDPGAQPSSSVPGIRLRRGVEWNGRVFAGGLHVEGARPMSALTDCATGEVTFALTNGDSGYTRPIGSAKLSDVEYIEEL
jgi:hypothetical protein